MKKLFFIIILVGLSTTAVGQSELVPANRIMLRADAYVPGINFEAKIYKNLTFSLRPHLKPSGPFRIDIWNGFHSSVDSDLRIYLNLFSENYFNNGLYFGIKALQTFTQFSGKSTSGGSSKGLNNLEFFLSSTIGIQHNFDFGLNIGGFVGPFYSVTFNRLIPVWGEINIGYAFLKR